MGFINRKINDKRIISVYNVHMLFILVDTSHVSHDMETQEVWYMVRGVIHCKLSTQKLNIKSTTKSEWVVVNEYLPYNVRYISFLGVQGYKIVNNILFQDNKSGIKIDTNGWSCCTGSSKHIEIKYY